MPGAGGMIGMYKKMPYETVKDLVPIVVTTPYASGS